VNIVADENLDADIVQCLRNEGHNVLSIADDFPGISDEEVLRIVHRHQAILITGDKDFGELVYHRGRTARGVVLIRIFGVSQMEKAQAVAEAFHLYSADFDKSFTVIGKNKVRIKKMD
jgi:predicted nuclease of predicted toxin-antitoxin system